MNTREMLNLRIVFVVLVIGVLAPSLIAETLYVNGISGDDRGLGTKDNPLKTIDKAAAMVNDSNAPGPTTIKVAPGVYNLTKSIVFENERPYTEKDRLVIEATILPDEPQWKPALMPIILSTEDPRKPEKLNALTGTYGLQIKISHVTIRGLKFLGNPLPNNWYNPVSRIGRNLKDFVVTQCMFAGAPDSFDIYCAALATGDGFIVEHCIFYRCHASVVYWDGLEGIGGKGCAMRYCIVDGVYQSGVWTCQTAEDFEFHHNIVTRSEYLWLRKYGDLLKYRLENCIVAGNKYYSGYGVESGPTGQTGPEISYDEKNVVTKGQVVLGKDKKKRNFLHVVPGTLGSDLGAGLFKK